MTNQVVSTDEHYMQLALQQARLATSHGDVPVGAVVVLDNVVIGVGRNQRELLGDPTAHAEVLALREAAKQLKMWRVEATLYVTHEPCTMCAGALVNSRIKRVVFGCDNPKAGGVRSLFQICDDVRMNHRMDVVGGVLADESAAELKAFFSELRKGPAYTP